MAGEKRLIDANALLEKYWKLIYDGYVTSQDVRCAIENAPTVDAVEVVRCKNCKHGDMCSIREAMACTVPDGFCWRGERRLE